MKKNHRMHVPCFKRWKRRNYAAFETLHRTVKIGVLSVAMSIILHATAAAEEFRADTSVLRTLEIDGIGVVSDRQAPTRSAASQTPLFNRDRAAAAPVQTLESVLRTSPAIDLRERGGKAVQADISIRGGSFDQTMVLLNGIDFTDARTGHQSHSLPVDVECVGEMALIDGISGVGAYSGAVDIRTRPLMPQYLRIEGTGGAHGYAYGSLSGALSKERFTLFAAGSYRRSDGYIHNTDFSNWNGFVRMNYDSERAGFFDFQAGYQNRAFGSNGFYAAYNRDQYEATQTALASLRWVQSWRQFTLTASASYRMNLDRYDWMRGTPMNRHDTDNAGAGLSGDYAWAGGTTSLGADYIFNHIFSTNLGQPLPSPHGEYTHADSRNAANIWLRHVKRWRRFDLSASGGVSITPYGTSGLWSVAGGYSPVGGLHVEAGVAQSMRLPTFTDLYYTSPAHINNPDLRPEKAVTARLGADYARGGWRASALTYYRRGRDIIDWVWRPEMGDKWHAEQESRLDTFGIELSGGYESEGWLRSATLSYGYISVDKPADIITSSVLDYMKHKAAASIEVAFLRRFTLALTGTVCDRFGSYTHYMRNADGEAMRDDGGNFVTESRQFEPYFTLDGRLSWSKGGVRIYLDATNITSTRYFDFGGLELPGCWVTAGAAITIGSSKYKMQN